MEFKKIKVNETAQRVNETSERYLNMLVRGLDNALGTVGLGGRKADYDDEHDEFVGGAKHELRKKHYDKSLRLLWKAEQHASWSSFHDLTRDEEMLMKMADDALNENEKREVARIKTAEFKALLNREYTPAQKQAIVSTRI